MGDDVVVALEDPVREPVVAQELPDVLDRVELGRARRQGQDGDVPGHDEGAGEVPAGPVEDEDGVGVRRHHGADLGEVLLHRGVSQNGMTMPAPLPSAGQIAPKM